MTPYDAYMDKQAGFLRAKFLSGAQMAPHEAKQWEAVTQRFAGRQIAKQGVPFNPQVSANLSQGANGAKSMEIGLAPREGQQTVGVSAFNVKKQQDGNAIGKTKSQWLQSTHQRQGFGSRSAQAMDDTMSGLGARVLGTNIENAAHVTPYRERMGYEPQGGTLHTKDVMTTPAVHRDRQRFATPNMERTVAPVPGTAGRGAPSTLRPLQTQPILRPAVPQPAAL